MRHFKQGIHLAVILGITVLSAGTVHGALLSYTITGDVLSGDESFPNVFGLTGGDTITAAGVFDDAPLTAGTGTISFGSGSGNTMTITVGTETFTASNEQNFASGFPQLTFSSFSLTDFDYIAHVGTNGAPADFDSYFTFFDDFDSLLGQWREGAEIAAVPEPLSAALVGTALLGLVAIRRKMA